MKKYLLNIPLALSLFLLSFQSFAQIRSISIGGGVNCPFFKEVVHKPKAVPPAIPSMSGAITYTGVGRVKETYEAHPGVDLAGRIDYELSPHVFISSGLSASYLRFKYSPIIVLQPYTNPTSLYPVREDGLIIYPVREGGQIIHDSIYQLPVGEPVSGSDRVGETTTLYLQLPLLAGTSLCKDKLILRAGINVGILLRATAIRQVYTLSGFEFPTNPIRWTPDSIVANTIPRDIGFSLEEVKDTDTGNFKKIQGSLLIQGSYLITRHISLDFTAQQFLTPIYETHYQDNKKSRYATLSLGVSYYIRTARPLP